jgi:hypothetical protein
MIRCPNLGPAADASFGQQMVQDVAPYLPDTDISSP